MNEAPFELLRSLYGAALAAVEAGPAVAAALADPVVSKRLVSARRVGIFAVGKAAAGMFAAAWKPGRRALVVLPRGYPRPRPPGVTVFFSAHPEPDSSSVRAARAALRFFSGFGREDLILCLVSGGASSLLCLPRTGITLAQKKRAIARLVRAGAPITRVNRLRTSLSAVKGGRLGRSTAARLVTLVLSDVPGDRPALVGSGPTVRGRRGDVTRVVASNRIGLEGAARQARRLRLRPRVLPRRLDGEARDAGRKLARETKRLRSGDVILAGGETTVLLGQKPGTGGRSLELALSAAQVLDGNPGIAILAAGSDGKDGTSRAAGALVDGDTMPRARKRGLDAEDALSRHDTEPFFARVGGLLVTGLTGTNVSDWAFGVRVLEHVAGTGPKDLHPPQSRTVRRET
jgi:hydroxypyruvate reductase